MIAQEVEKVLPEVVTTGSNGRKKVAYMELVPLLIEAMKELQRIYDSKFKQQQEINTRLLDKVEILEQELKLKNNIAMAVEAY